MKRTLTIALLAVLGLASFSVTKAEAQRHREASIGFKVGKLNVNARFRSPFSRVRQAPHCHTSHCGIVRTGGFYKIESYPVVRRGFYKNVHVPARYETRYDSCGNPFTVLIEAACTRRVYVPGRTVYERRRVWVKPSVTYSCGY